MKSNLLQLLRYMVIVGAATGAYYALVLARASALFQQDTAVSVAAAVDLQPHNALYLDRLASWQPDNRKALLLHSVAENPFNSNAWIRLGFMAEMEEGDNVQAQKYYLQASNVNHMFLPRWTLTNFFFRQQKVDDFFHWTKATLAVTPYASDPVFAQMWQMTQDQDTLNSAIPDNPKILLQYAWFLSNNKLYDSIPRAVDRLVHLVDKTDAGKWGRDDLLAVSEDHMVAAGQVKPALAVWRTLTNAGWIESSVPTEDKPLTNGDFRQPFYRHGFDWTTDDNSGTRVEQYADSSQVRISLFGDEAEKVSLLQQYIWVAPDSHYTLTWQANQEDLASPSGIFWRLHPVGSTGTDLVSGDLTDPNQSWDFVTAANAKIYLLTLDYQRVLGTTRARGTLILKSTSMNKQN